MSEESADNGSLTVKQKIGDAANDWLEKNKSVVLRQTPKWAQGLAITMLSLGSLMVIGGIVFRIDEVVTVQGQLQSIGGTSEVKTPVGGKVSSVFIEEGMFVKEGQLIMVFDTDEALAQKTALESQLRLENQQLEALTKTYESQLASMEGNRRVINARIRTKKLLVENMETLVEQGGFQRMQYLQQKDSLYELEEQSLQLDDQINRTLLEKSRVELDNEKSRSRINSQLKQINLQIRYRNVTSPVSGIAFDLKANNYGVLASGERIVSIVPQQGLAAEVFVPNKDIGFVKPGQEVKVRIDAFPFTRYGDIQGKITRIGADALEPNKTIGFYHFPVNIELNRSYLEAGDIKIPLKSGMSVTSNIKLRDKRVITLVSDIFSSQTDSLRTLRQ